MEKKWIYKPLPSKEQIENFGKAINLNPYLTAILLQRGVSDLTAAKNFFVLHSNSFTSFLMLDMNHAVERLHNGRSSKVSEY